MKGDLFSSDHVVQPAVAPGMSVENAKCLRYVVNGDMLARQGAMVAYRGNLQFERKGQGWAACSSGRSPERGCR